MDDHPLDDAFLKVERARELSDQLNSEYTAAHRKHPMKIRQWTDPISRHLIFELEDFPTWPPRWSVIVGEIGHDLRSALDYLVFQLGTTPELEKTAFPISGDEDEYFQPKGRKQISYRDTCLAGVDSEWAAKIDDLQPFKSSGMPNHALETLHRMSNRDKHRIRLRIFSLVELPFAKINAERSDYVTGLKIWMTPDGEIGQRFSGKRPKVKDERTLLGFEPKVPPDNRTGFYPVFGEFRIPLWGISRIVAEVQQILVDFKPALDPAPWSDESSV